MLDVVRHVIVCVMSVGGSVLDVVRHVTVCQVSWRECVRCSETCD